MTACLCIPFTKSVPRACGNCVRGAEDFQKSRSYVKNSKGQKDDMQEVLYCELYYTVRHGTQCSRSWFVHI